MHGDSECRGNVQQLCVAKVRSIVLLQDRDEALTIDNLQQHWTGPSGEVNPWADWWNVRSPSFSSLSRLDRTCADDERQQQFVQCVNYGPTSRIGDESLARSCAKVVGHGSSCAPSLLSSTVPDEKLNADEREIQIRMGQGGRALRFVERWRGAAAGVSHEGQEDGARQELYDCDQRRGGVVSLVIRLQFPQAELIRTLTATTEQRARW